MKQSSKIRLRQVEKALAKSSAASFIPVAIKLRMAEVIFGIMERRKQFGLFVILGWRGSWKRYADTPDISQDLFARRRVNIMNIPNGARPQGPRPKAGNGRRGNIRNTVSFDGAILVDRKGNVLHSGTMIEGLRPRAVARKLNPRVSADLSSQFGFRRKVHMRHITAITSSYTFKGTTVFTVSEETDDFHVFENGTIVYSTVRGESKR